MKGFLIGLVLVLAIGGGIFGWWVSTSNSEIRLRNRIEAQKEVTEAFYTKFWEIMKTQAGIVKENVKNQKEFAQAVMEGRYSTGEKSMMWIQEQNPNFDPSGYDKLMNSVEGLREGFFVEQKKLLDMDRQHKDMRMTFPKKIVIGKRPDIEIIILKNEATKNAYETGTDSSPELF